MYELPYNRPLFHHREITNRSRLAITVWLIFGIVFAIVILQMKLYVLTSVLLGITAVIHYLLQKYFLPVLGKKKLIAEIEQLNKNFGK